LNASGEPIRLIPEFTGTSGSPATGKNVVLPAYPRPPGSENPDKLTTHMVAGSILPRRKKGKVFGNTGRSLAYRGQHMKSIFILILIVIGLMAAAIPSVAAEDIPGTIGRSRRHSRNNGPL